MATGTARRGAPASAAAFAPLEEALESAIASGLIPGAVVAVGRRGRPAWIRAFGHRSLKPRRERMTSGTIFDLASLTKPMVTGVLAARCVDRGLLGFSDPLEAHLLEARGSRIGAVPLSLLLTHTAGLEADNPLGDYRGGKSALYSAIARAPLQAEPGTRFEYSDVGYVLMQGALERRSGLRLDRMAQAEVFAALAFRDTRYRVPARARSRCAPTTRERGRWLRGRPHDPRARSRALNGVAGHAGVFGTAVEVARFCEMLLAGGVWRGRAVLSIAGLRALTGNQCAASVGARRSFGFDIESPYSAPRGDRFSGDSYGHSGYTGVSMWIDPRSGAYVVLLTNAVHPDGHRDLKGLRRGVATLAADALGVDREGPAPALPQQSR